MEKVGEMGVENSTYFLSISEINKCTKCIDGPSRHLGRGNEMCYFAVEALGCDSSLVHKKEVVETIVLFTFCFQADI